MINKVNFTQLFNEALEDIFSQAGKIKKDYDYAKAVKIINDPNTSNELRLKLYKILPPSIRKNIKINEEGKLTGQPINPNKMSSVYKFQDYKGRKYDDVNLDKLAQEYRWIPSGRKGSDIPYKSMITNPKTQSKQVYKNYKQFVSLFKNIIDPVVATIGSFDGDEYKLSSRLYRSKKDKEIAFDLNLRNPKVYNHNRYIQTIDEKLTSAFSKIVKGEQNNMNPDIQKLLELINQQTEGAVKKASIVIPYSYLISLAYGDTDKQLSFLEICSLLLKYNLFFEPKSDEELQAYVYFNSNINKWRAFVENGGSLKQVHALSDEERKEKIDSLAEKTAKSSYISQEDMPINDIIAKVYGFSDPAQIQDVINTIKKEFSFTDEEWDNEDKESQIEFIEQFKDKYNELKNK